MRNTSHISGEPPVELQHIGDGDEQAFRRLFQYYSPRLNQFAYSIVKIKEAATEIVDDVFIKLWKQRENVSSISNIRVYLYVAVKNSSLNYLSSKAHRQITEPYLNEVRRRAGLGNLTAVQVPSQAAFRLTMEHERRVEFAFENLRWYDLVRTDRAITVLNGKSAQINLVNPVTPQNQVFPIPQSQIDINKTKITQNEGSN